MNTQDIKAIWNQIINNCQIPNNGNSQGELKQQLMTLVHGNSATANRLLSGEQRSHPNHTQQWYLEKVIYDLQRAR